MRIIYLCMSLNIMQKHIPMINSVFYFKFYQLKKKIVENFINIKQR